MKSLHKAKAFLQLLRLPNLFSVPGDVLAGYVLAGGMLHAWLELAGLCIASLCAYIFGLITNDLADLKEDAAERPERPLPSGAISRTAAFTAAVASALTALAFSGVTLRTLLICSAMLLCILLYNCVLKKSSGPGGAAAAAAGMGLCRGLNVWLGVLLVGEPDYLPAACFALGEVLYIAGVTLAAKEETKTMEKRPGRLLFLIGAGIAYLTLFTMVSIQKTDSFRMLASGFLSAVAAAVFVILAYWGFRILRRRCSPGEAQAWIGILVWNLIFLQAAAVSARMWILCAAALLAAALAAKITAIKFYGS